MLVFGYYHLDCQNPCIVFAFYCTLLRKSYGSACVRQGVLAEVELLQEITEATRAAVGAFVEDRTDAEGRVTSNALTNFARLAGLGQQPYMKALQVSTLQNAHSHAYVPTCA